MKTVALLTAAGTGSRMGQDIPKQFLSVNERPVIIYTLEAFQRHPQIDSIAVVLLEGWEPFLRAYARQFGITKLEYIIPGGSTNNESIRNGLFELEKHFESDDLVLIHDSIRPMVSREIISDCIATAEKYGNATVAIPCAEAMLETEDAVVSCGSYPRERLKRTQTPQAFRIGDICALHREAQEKGITNSVASCTLMVELGRKVYFSPGSEKNIKLTTVDDIDIFKALLSVRHEDYIKS